MAKGRYIVIEGSDGIGKTTQARDLLVPRLQKAGITAHYAHEPGGTAMAEGIEALIKKRQLQRHPMSNLLLFTAARVEMWQQVIAPALAKGDWVVADRNWLSSVVYQGYAEGLGIDTVQALTSQALPPDYLYPDITILGQASQLQQQRLLEHRGKSHEDYFESKQNSFQQALRDGYHALEHESRIRSRFHPSTLHVVSFDGSQQTVHERIWQQLTNLATNNA